MRLNLFTGICAAALTVVLLTDAASAGTTTFAEAKALAASTEKPLLLDFYATW